MIEENEVHQTIEQIIERQINALGELKEEGKLEEDADVEEILVKNIQQQIDMSLSNLKTLFDDFVNKDDCTLSQALEFIPLLTVYGLINGAQLGVTQEEYYLIVDYYLERYDLLAKGE